MKTFKDFYLEAKNSERHITPAQQFIKDIAEEVGCSEFTVRQWLYGIQKPSIATQRLIAQFLNADHEGLFPDEGESR